MNIFVSNGFMSGDVLQSIDTLVHSNFKNIEVSTGLCDESTLGRLKTLQKQGIRIRLHNYFPNIGTPFVLNLASNNSEVISRSKELIERALEWSSELNSPYYAFHAGFRLSPHADELGGHLTQRQLVSRQEAKQKFLSELDSIAQRAASLGVTIAVENNVYDAANAKIFGDDNPLLMTGSTDTDLDLPDNVGILLDFGHLNVSAFTEKFDRAECLTRWSSKINGYHISDNNRLRDSNDSITKDSWFWPNIDKTIPNITLEVYEKDLNKLKHNMHLLENFYKD